MEADWLLAINGLRAPALDPLMAFLSRWGIYGFPLLMLVALRNPDRRRAAASIRDGWLSWFVAITLAETILKPLVHRPRPTADAALREALEVLGRMPSPRSLSFPSGTSTAAFAGAVWIGLRWGWRWGTAALALAVVVSFSRLYAGVHWPSDIVAGALLGAGCAVGLDRVSRWIGQG